MSGAYTMGYVGGFLAIIILFIICAIIFLGRLNTDNAARTKYDERQQLVRGLGYKYAFWTLVILLAVDTILRSMKVPVPMDDSVRTMTILFISVLVHTVYCIFNDGYFGINNSPKRYYIAFLFIGLANVLIAIGNAFRNGFIENGKLQFPFMNLMCAFLFVILAICIIIKNMINKKEDDNDEYDEDVEEVDK